MINSQPDNTLDEQIDKMLLPYFGVWKSKGDTFYFATNANEIARNELKQQLLSIIEQSNNRAKLPTSDPLVDEIGLNKIWRQYIKWKSKQVVERREVKRGWSSEENRVMPLQLRKLITKWHNNRINQLQTILGDKK